MSLLQEMLDALGYETRSYSGRVMFGKECLGVETANIQRLFQEILRLAINEDAVSYLQDELVYEGARWDNLGKNWIVCWPDVEYEDE